MASAQQKLARYLGTAQVAHYHPTRMEAGQPDPLYPADCRKLFMEFLQGRPDAAITLKEYDRLETQLFRGSVGDPEPYLLVMLELLRPLQLTQHFKLALSIARFVHENGQTNNLTTSPASEP